MAKPRKQARFLPWIFFNCTLIALSQFLVSCGSSAGRLPDTSIQSASQGITVSVNPSGAYFISASQQGMSFTGDVGAKLSDITIQSGNDGVGAFQQIVFDYVMRGRRQASVSLYSDKPLVLFRETYLEPQANAGTFPQFAPLQTNLFHLTYNSQFGRHSFTDLPPDGPWIFFDPQGHTFVISPASNFLVTDTSVDSHGKIGVGITSGIASLPQGFTHTTALVLGNGINSTIDLWGHILTDLQGKVRPANDSDRVLKFFGYWTDNGATYYYHTDPALDYQHTLFAVRDDFAAHGIPLGYMQLDSWFYPKGPAQDWQDTAGGISQYIGAPALFPSGLQGFQQQLGLPLVTHARWIDAASPYRQQYKISGNAAIDPAYWALIAGNLQAAATVTYEQDWLDGPAHTDLNLNDPPAFLDDMAAAMAKDSLTIQYCLPLARDFLQSSRYNDVTTIRTSGDRFGPTRWIDFLYASRLAGSLGLWPWSDVFMSNEQANLLLSVLSAGPVGVGDPIGGINAANIHQAIRADGIIVKPDAPLSPTDETVLNDAAGRPRSMVASTFSDFGGSKTFYVVALPRGGDTSVSFSPASLGMAGPVYVYRWDSGTGQFIDAQSTINDTIAGQFAYYILAPVGASQIALLGDTQQFVALGKARIPALVDTGSLSVTVSFATGEANRTLLGFSLLKPTATAVRGAAGSVAYNAVTHLFTVQVFPDAGGAAVVTLAP